MTAAPQNQGMMYASLYVGDLHPLATDGVLLSRFSEIGPVVTAKVCRDLTTKNSLGYGYVNFEEPKHAEKALEFMNYEPIMGRPIRLMWSQRDPSLRKSGKGNIFIKNLDKSIEQKELYDTFSYFGKILSSKIATDERGNSKGYGFIHFEDENCAEVAISKLNNMMLRDSIVYVGKFIPRSERRTQARKPRFNNIYVKNFPLDTDDNKLHEMFREFGEIKSACVMKDHDGKSKGFGFVCFGDPDDAEKSVRCMHGKECNDRQLHVCRAQKKEERQEELRMRMEKQRAERQSRYLANVNLYVKNLDDSIDDKRLKEEFNKFGEITSAKVMTDGRGVSKGFGFVCFTHADQAAKAVTDMNGSIVGSKPLYVALAQRKEDRRAKLCAEYQQRAAQYRNTLPPMMPTVAGHAAAHTYFQPTPFQQTQRYYHAPGVLNSQPRWNRAAAMTGGVPTQIGVVSNRPPIAGHYLNTPNPTAVMNAGQMAAFAPLRTPAVGRPMLPSGVPPMPTGHLPNGAIINQAINQRPQTGRQNVMSQILAAPANVLNQRPSMASVVAGSATNNSAVRMSRGMVHSAMPSINGMNANVRFNQTARNVSQPNVPIQQSNMVTNSAPIGDQVPLIISDLAKLSEGEQKQMLGERLFPLVKEMYPDLASKLTGMLLMVNNSEIIHYLESREALRERCEEGIETLKNSQQAAQFTDAMNSEAKGDNKVTATDCKNVK